LSINNYSDLLVVNINFLIHVFVDIKFLSQLATSQGPCCVVINIPASSENLVFLVVRWVFCPVVLGNHSPFVVFLPRVQ